MIVPLRDSCSYLTLRFVWYLICFSRHGNSQLGTKESRSDKKDTAQLRDISIVATNFSDNVFKNV